MISDFMQEIIDGNLVVVDKGSLDSKCSVSSAITPMCLKALKKEIVIYKEIEPVKGSYVIDNGFRLGRYTDSEVCSVPVRLYTDEGFTVSVDKSKSSIFYFDKHAVLEKVYTVDKTSENRNPVCAGFSDTTIFIGTEYNRLIAIDKNSGDVIWEFGEYNSRGRCKDGKIGSVYSIKIARNGNLLVLTHDGAGENKHYYGTLEEFSKDGTWKRTLLYHKGTGLGSKNETFYPVALQCLEDIVYVAKEESIDVFSYMEDGLIYERTIRKPATIGVENLGITDFSIHDNLLYVLSRNMKKVVCFDMVTGKILFNVGHYNYESASFIIHEGNAMNNPTGMLVTDDHILVADSSNYNIIEIFRDDYIYPKYNIPKGISLLYASLDMTDDNRVKIKVGEEPPTLHIVYKK